MSKLVQAPLGQLALALSVGGIVLAVLVAAVGSLLGHAWLGMAYLIFAAAQVVALVLGLTVRAQPASRAAAIASALLLTISLLIVA